jgi:WD40 repeat protein
MSLQTAAIAFTPQGRCLAAGSTAMTDEAESFQLQVWDGITGKRLFATQPQPYPILSLSFTHDGKVLASGGFDRVVTLWDMNSLLA